MKRWSKKLGLGNGKAYSPQSSWTKYDQRLFEGIENEDLVKVKSAMRKKGISCLKQDAEGRRALHVACMKGLGGCLKIMLKEEKPDLTTMDASGRTPLHLAARSGSEDCIKYLMHYKSPVDIQDIGSMSPLHYAVSGGHENPTSLLLHGGAPVNPKDKEGRTPLILAVQSGNEEIVSLLCSAGAHVNIQDNTGRTALMFASEYGMEKIVQQLLSSGADAEVKDLTGETAESLATSAGKHEIAEILKRPNTNGIVNGHGSKIGEYDDLISEMDESIAIDDSLTLNSSSSFDEQSFQESLSECSPRSMCQIELGKFENSSIFKELNSLKSELHTETLKRTKAEDEIRTLRMQLESGQENEDDSAINFSDGDSDDILIAIEKNVPSPFQSTSEDVEDSPLVSALRGDVHALESQIERLKKELENARNNEESKGTKIPLTVYRALKETHEALKTSASQETENLKETVKENKEKAESLTKENQGLQRKVTYYKELLEKGDKSEKIRELNEQIVSLKIQISHDEKLQNENETLRSENEEFQQRLLKTKSFRCPDSEIQASNTNNMGENEGHKKRIERYRSVLLSIFQGNLSVDLEEILSKIVQLRSNKPTEC